MLIPRRTKWRKQHRPTRSGMSKGGTQLAFGEYGIQALEPAYVTNRQINIFPDRPLTKKALGLRMGSGKGPVETWVANVKPGRVMFEMGGVAEPLAREAMLRAMHKLPMKTRFITREEGE